MCHGADQCSVYFGEGCRRVWWGRGCGGDVLDCGVYGAGGEEAGEVGGGEFVVCCCCCGGTFGRWGFGDKGFLEGGFLWLVIFFFFSPFGFVIPVLLLLLGVCLHFG